jgi:hypothetical protein
MCAILPKLITLSLFRAESANAVPCGRIYPLRLTTVAPPSDEREFLDRVERVDIVDGVETARSRSGTASRAREGEILGDGELGLWSGDATLLSGGLVIVSVILAEELLLLHCRRVLAGVTSFLSPELLMGRLVPYARRSQHNEV